MGETTHIIITPRLDSPRTLVRAEVSQLPQTNRHLSRFLFASRTRRAQTERWLLDSLAKTFAPQILKVAHHGSRYSSTPRFLQAVQPLNAVVMSARATIPPPDAQTLDVLRAWARACSAQTSMDDSHRERWWHVRVFVQGRKEVFQMP